MDGRDCTGPPPGSRPRSVSQRGGWREEAPPRVGSRSRPGSLDIAGGPGQEGLAGTGLSFGLWWVLWSRLLCFSVLWSLRSQDL